MVGVTSFESFGFMSARAVSSEQWALEDLAASPYFKPCDVIPPQGGWLSIRAEIYQCPRFVSTAPVGVAILADAQ